MRLIDADELKKDIHKEWDEVRVWDESGAATADQFEILVDSAPTVEERKKGKWINDKGLYKCSSCGELWVHWWASVVPLNRIYKELRYCPYCGAEMGEREEK